MWLTVVLAAIVLFLDIRSWQWVLDTDPKLSIDLVGLKTNLADMRMHISRFAGNKMTDEGHVEK